MSNPDDLVRQAVKKLNPGFFAKLTSSEADRKEEACQLYKEAANRYKVQKNWMKAGECYEKAGELEEQTGGTAAYVAFQDGAHCYGFVDQTKKNRAMDRCISACEKSGKYMQAGKLVQAQAQEYEENLDYENAIERYKKAQEFYSFESMNTKSMQSKCLEKVADLMCVSNHKDMYEEAPKIYEKLGMQYLTNTLLKSSAKDMFFKCVVVYLAKKDEVSADINLKKFLLEDPTFDETRESNFLKEAIECVKEPSNPEGFKKAVNELKAIKDLDKWKLTMFAAVLKNIEEEDDLK